jgi:hypothetical protein
MYVNYMNIEVERVAIQVQSERRSQAPADYWSPLPGETDLPSAEKLAQMLRNAMSDLGVEPDYVTLAILNSKSGRQSSKTVRFAGIQAMRLRDLFEEVLKECERDSKHSD